MSKAALQRAIECLQISDIWQHSVSASIGESLETQEKFPEQHEVLFKHVVLRSLWGKSDDTETGPYVFRVQVALGVRFEEKHEDPAPENKQQSSNDAMLAQIEATYVAEYLAERDPGQDALKAFALRNASYHIWPFWREFLASQCARMNLPKVSLPLRSVAANHAEPGQE